MKKLFDFKMAGSVLLMLAISLASCKQDLTVQPNPSVERIAPEKVVDLDIQGVKVKDGVLHFTDGKAFRNAIEILNNSNSLSYKAYCDKIGFKSQFILLDEAIDAINLMTDNVQFEAFKKANSTLFKYEDESIDLKMDYGLLAKLVDKDGLFYVDKTLNLYDKEGYIIILDGDKSKMEQAKLNRKNDVVKGVVIGNKNGKLQTRAACGVAPNTGWINNSSSNRRGILYAESQALEIFYGPYSSQKDVDFYAYFKGRAQKKSFGVWNDYSTDNWLNITCELTANPNPDGSQGSVAVTKNFVNQQVSSTNTNLVTFLGVVNTWTNVASSTAFSARPFNSINSTYTNGGSVNANLQCQ